MSVTILIHESIFGGYYRRGRRWTVGLLAHSLQCGQRWVFLIRRGKRRLGYRTHGDAPPAVMTYHDAGWHWPWRPRAVSGRG